jgi:predicted transcriptional regulator
MSSGAEHWRGAAVSLAIAGVPSIQSDILSSVVNMSASAKQLLREAIEQVPEDASIEDVMDRLYFLAKVAHGLEAADRGEVVTHEDIEREFLPRE